MTILPHVPLENQMKSFQNHCTMVNDRLVIWNSVNPFNESMQLEGCLVHLQQLVQNVQNNFDGDLIILSSPRYANLLAYKKEALNNLKYVKDDDSCKIKYGLKKVPKQIGKECEETNLHNSTYEHRETPKLMEPKMLKKNGSVGDGQF